METRRVPIRALSVRLFNDSKRIEALLSTGDKLYSEIVGKPITEHLGLHRSYPEVTFCLFGSMRLRGESFSLFGEPITFPIPTVDCVQDITLNRPRHTDSAWILTVENKESFYTTAEAVRHGWRTDSVSTPPSAVPYPVDASKMPRTSQVSTPPSAVLYTAGHPNGAVRRLLSLFVDENTSVFHFGDMDPDGLLILQELSDRLPVPIRPFLMDAETFQSYQRFGRPLTDTALKRLERFRLQDLSAVATLIRESRTGIEQEVIPVHFG